MRIGFTGTQAGMTVKQQGELLRWLTRFINRGIGPDSEFTHGMCIGADEQAHKIAWALHYVICGHPSNIDTKTMVHDSRQFLSIAPRRPPLERNGNIVTGCEVLIAAPRQRKEEQRSGTWATIRHARERGLTTLMVWP